MALIHPRSLLPWEYLISIISSVMFAMKMALATAGESKKANRKPVFDLLLGAVSLCHAVGAAQMTYDMLFKKKKICIYALLEQALFFPLLPSLHRLLSMVRRKFLA